MCIRDRSHPDRCACKPDEFIRVRDAYRHLCDEHTPGAMLEYDSDEEELDQASTGGHVQTIRLPLKHKTAQFAGQRFHLTGSFHVNGDVSECGTRGQTLVRKFIQHHAGKVVKTLTRRVSCVVA
eukprot:2946497-Prymnesium_polylepis.1